MFKYAAIRICFYLIPAALITYAEGRFDLDFFSDPSKEKNLKNLFLISGLILTSIIFPITFEIQKKILKKHSKIIPKIFSWIRESANDDLSSYFEKGDLHLNIRIFLRKRGFFEFFDKIGRHKIYFELYNLQGLYQQEVQELAFEVAPIPQGLVGNAFKEGKIWYDFNLKLNHSKPEYNLKMRQIQTTDEAEFAVACPYVNKKDKIDIIITFDSPVKVTEPNDEEWIEIIKEACKVIILSKPLFINKIFEYESD